MCDGEGVVCDGEGVVVCDGEGVVVCDGEGRVDNSLKGIMWGSVKQLSILIPRSHGRCVRG